MTYFKVFICCILLFQYRLDNSFKASSSILMNQETLEVIEGKNIHHVQSVASISKVMTAIIVIENLNIFNEISIPKDVLKAYGSAIYIQPHQKISILDLLYGLLLRSGNDAALCLESQLDNFVDLMNQKAKSLHMEHTEFRNSTGLDEQDGGNLSCAYDMAILMSYAMNNEIFKQIVSTKKYKRLDGNGYWKNKNKLLNYEFCIGGKTGYTKKAGRTLVTCASNDLTNLVCVTFRCVDDFAFHEKLYDLYFKKYKYFFDLDTF